MRPFCIKIKQEIEDFLCKKRWMYVVGSSFDREPEGARAAAKSRLKQKFRERQAAAKPGMVTEHHQQSRRGNSKSGEEFYQSLDFYSRSLKAVSIKEE